MLTHCWDSPGDSGHRPPVWPRPHLDGLKLSALEPAAAAGTCWDRKNANSLYGAVKYQRYRSNGVSLAALRAQTLSTTVAFVSAVALMRPLMTSSRGKR